MSTYYRVADASLHELDDEQWAGMLANGKAAGLRPYSVEPEPAAGPGQRVEPGPLVVDETSARRTWVLVDVPPRRIAVAPRQIRHALNAAGLRDAVEAAVAAGGRDLTDWWEYSITIESDHPMVAAMAAALGQSEAQVRALFEAAEAL